MKTTYLKYIGLLLCLFALSALGCQQEDDYVKQAQSTNQKSITKNISGKDIPEVLNFIQSKSNSRLQFTLDDSNSPEGQFRSHEENLSLTTAITEQIQQVTDGYGKSNYTFKLIEEETKEGVYFINLVVKEYKDSFYLYIMKYVPDTNWLESNNDISNFNSFTGTIYFYSDIGLYLAKIEMLNGISTSIEKHPCDDEGNDSGGDSDSSSGGGTTSGTGTSDGDTSNNSNSGDNSGGTGGSNVDVIFTCCECNGDLVGEHDHVECTIEIIFNLSTNSDGDIIGDGKSFNDYLRHPCDTPEVCYEVNGDPCTYGCNETGDGCADNPNENDDVGVLFDSETYSQLIEFFGEDNIEIDNTLTDEETLNFDSFESIEDFFDDLVNNNFENESSEIFPGSIREDTHRMLFDSFPEASILANIRVNVPDANNDLECLELVSLNTILEGNISFFDWTQTSHIDPNEIDGPLVTINEYYNTIRFKVRGFMLVGLNIEGFPMAFRVRQLLSIDIVYNYSTGELIEDSSYWYYENN